MSSQKSSAKKRIPVGQLKPGMYVVELDCAWINTPFLFHRRKIMDTCDIEMLAQHGIREVIIDTERGSDVPNSQPMPVKFGEIVAPTATSSRGDHQKVLEPLMQELSLAKVIHQEA